MPRTGATESSVYCVVWKIVLNLIINSDDESDYEEPKRTLSRTEGSVPSTAIQPSKQTGRAPAKHSKSVTSLQINRLLYNFNDFRVDGLTSTDGKDKKHYKLVKNIEQYNYFLSISIFFFDHQLKDEKPCGPPPFDNTTAAVFEVLLHCNIQHSIDS